MSRPRILMADDHLMLLFSRLHPDVVLLDVAMPLLNGLDAGRQLKAQRRSVKLIYLTMNPDPDLAGEALRLGASGYVLKSSAARELKQAIQEALRGRSYITPLITGDVVGSLIEPRSRRAELTGRQREVLQLLAEGKSMKEVAVILDLTPRTVAFHKYRMMEQLRLKSSAELVKFAVQSGVVA
jgi:DNA-binding NarL/FixJ family response regulator